MKIRTAQSNSLIKILGTEDNIAITQEYITNRIIKFTWDNFDLATSGIKIGQYVKIQIAYEATDGTVGYYSTVAVAKFTSKPNIYMKNVGEETTATGIPLFKQSYTGVYEVTEDKNERPYAYNFYLYDSNKDLIEESGWKLHNTSVNALTSESLQLSQTIDVYNYKTSLAFNQEYYIQYGVRTINNLEVFSPVYTCIETQETGVDTNLDLYAENVFEDGYVLVKLKKKDGVQATKINSALSFEISRAEVGYETYSIQPDNLYNFSWQALRRVYFAADTAYADIERWDFKDFTVEQGVRYLYCYKIYNNNDVFSSRIVSNLVEADFEDMFLFDGKLQLKIRFNPKVSSFKINRQEQKIDTIGSKFPFIFRNGIVEYREFPISGLISYLSDNNQLFFNKEDDLEILPWDTSERPGTPANDNTSWQRVQTLDSVGYNMRAERRFKMKLLEWLNNGKIKLFRSPAEGNYLVRLMNSSLTPEDKLGRMLHTFSSTAYEVEEMSYENLISLHLLDVDHYTEARIGIESVKIKDKIGSSIARNTSKLLGNQEHIINIMSIEPSPNTEATSFYVRIGVNNEEHKVLLHTGRFTMTTTGELPSVWINAKDNEILSEDLANAASNSARATALKSLVGDAVFTYKYSYTQIEAGSVVHIPADGISAREIQSVEVINKIGSLIGGTGSSATTLVTIPITQTYSNKYEEILQFYVLNFIKKEVIPLYVSGGYNYLNANHSTRITSYDENSLYTKDTDDANYWFSTNGTSLNRSISKTNANLTKIHFEIDNNGHAETIEYNDVPLIDLKRNKFTNIAIGALYQVDYAYQIKIITYAT